MPAIHRPVETRDRFVSLFGHAPTPYADAITAGFSRHALDAAVRRDLLLRPRRGILIAPRNGTGASERDAHHERVHAAVRSSRVQLAGTYESAALLHGLATPRAGTPTGLSLVALDGSGRHVAGEHRRASPVTPDQLEVVDEILVTSLARTAIDLARGHRLPSALIPLDSAARLWISRESGVTGRRLRPLVRQPDWRERARTELEIALSRVFGWSGTVAVRQALAFVDPCSESALESRSRGWFIEAGLGPLNPGSPIDCRGTTYWADFCDPLRRVVGEADGWGKYGRNEAEVHRALRRERLRADDLVEDGWAVVRWTTSDTRERVLRRMSDALRARRPGP